MDYYAKSLMFSGVAGDWPVDGVTQLITLQVIYPATNLPL
ncbi:hypothetical protein O59_000404 [Cellvibrio sp. BR]|nr:hypothetical protein O59_000404 [Cellvibrio sp. BR]